MYNSDSFYALLDCQITFSGTLPRSSIQVILYARRESVSQFL